MRGNILPLLYWSGWNTRLMSSSTMRVLNSKTRTECKETVGAGLSGLDTFIAAKFLTSNVNK